MTILFETRFSFFGQSGWKSSHAADPGLLFDDDRLEQRMTYFEQITLESLKGQTDDHFNHMVLSSTLMPKTWQTRLRELVIDTLGAKRARVMFRPKGKAGRFLKDAVVKTYGDDIITQVVLDDDDAVSADFVAALRGYAQIARRDPLNDAPYSFITFPRGYTLGIEEGRMSWLAHRYVPYTNLGLALVGPAPSSRNPYLTSHRKIGERHPSFMVTHRRPFYLRAVHGLNDSFAKQKGAFLTDEEIVGAFRYFPWMERHFPGLSDNSALAAQ